MALGSSRGYAAAGLGMIVGNLGEAVEIRWQTRSNATYFVEVSDDLEGDFQPLGFGIVADGDEARLLDLKPAQRSRFYRIRELSDEAASYRDRAGGLDPESLRDVDLWFRGLRELGILSNVVWQSSFRSRLNAASNTVLPSLTGANGRIGGSPVMGSRGLRFLTNDWVEFLNPLPLADALTPRMTLIADFASDGGAVRTLVSSDRSGARGPALIAGGSRTQGPGLEDLFFDITLDGLNSLPDPSAVGRRTFNRGNTGSQQFSMACWNESELSLRTDIDRVYSSPNSFGSAWNGNTFWRVGAQLDGGYGFVGSISFVAVLDRALLRREYSDVRHLYYRTLGKGLARPVNAILEGDSLTEEGAEKSWGEHLLTASHWKGLVNKLNVARGGENTAQMGYEFDLQVLPYADEPGRNYLFLWGGANDLGSSDGTTLFNRLRAYWRRARAAGFKVVAFTLIPRSKESQQLSTERALANALIAAALSEYDYLIDVAKIPQLQDPQDANYYRPDGIHLRSAGNERIAERINDVIPDP